jgi:hypothetical protein
MGPTIDELVIGDRADDWATAGFAVDTDGTCRVGAVRLRFEGDDDGRRLKRWSLRDVGPVVDDSIDGLHTTISDAPSPPPADHDNGTLGIDHVVVLTTDVDRTVGALEAAGIEQRRTRHIGPEQYGFAARQTFFRLGGVVLELIGPDEPAGADDRPARFYGLAFTVRDIDALPARFGDGLGRVKDAVQPGRRIATLRHKDLGLSVAVAFMSPGPGAL